MVGHRQYTLRDAFCVTCLVLTLCSGTVPAWADEESDTRARLQQLKSDMARLGEELQKDKAEQGVLRAALRQSEVAIGKLQTSIKQTNKELQWTSGQLADLQAQRRQQLVARGQQQELITREIQAAYQMGRQSQLKILLNQEQPDTLARSMAYYNYFYEARKRHIEKYLAIIARIDALEPEITSTAAQLQRTQHTLDQQRSNLLNRRQQRQLDLHKLNASIVSKADRLAKMTDDRKDLERLLEAIEQAIVDMHTPADYQGFDTLKGKMPWPLHGKPRNRYGSKRGDGGLRWQGLVIPAEEGSTVNAIHHGRVVFADWFRGSGLLLIIDHGAGYMSLYAHNQALLREVGEWVSAGAAISTVGDSGGQQESALYFEIRENGTPTNPGHWLNRG